MSKKRHVWATALVSTALITSTLIASGCTSAHAESTTLPTQATETRAATETPAPTVGLANLAAVHCENQGHKLEIRSDKKGNQYGVCVFADGTECEEWAYYRGECSPGAPRATLAPTAAPIQSTATPVPSPESAAACTQNLDYRGGWEDKTALSKEIQAETDQIIVTFQLPGDLTQ